MIEALAGIGTAFGLAGSAGLNAYIPLLVVAIAAYYPLNNPLIQLGEPYNAIGSPWAIGIIAILLIIEMLVDKVPAIDTINDGIQTFIRPAAGAFLFAANAGVINDMHPILALGSGLIIAGGVHTAKGMARPVVTASTAGTGNWLVSLGEDVLSFGMTITALVLPFLAAVIILFVMAFLIYVFYRFHKRRERNKMFKT